MLSNTLRFAARPIMDDHVCTSVYRQHFRPTSNICLSGIGASTCNGDSGSSLTMSIRGRNTLVGVVSYGSRTCEDGYPIVMTRVTAYLDWIAENTGMRI
jgi:secreted trypsin-like serine protease